MRARTCDRGPRAKTAQVFAPWHACALDRDCIAPRGATRDNHRHDQTVVNAILCRLNVTLGHEDRKWRLGFRDAEPPEARIQPTEDETGWNDLVLYNRRDADAKPYAAYATPAASYRCRA
jgi:hypothetical protein